MNNFIDFVYCFERTKRCALLLLLYFKIFLLYDLLVELCMYDKIYIHRNDCLLLIGNCRRDSVASLCFVWLSVGVRVMFVCDNSYVCGGPLFCLPAILMPMGTEKRGPNSHHIVLQLFFASCFFFCSVKSSNASIASLGLCALACICIWFLLFLMAF